MVIFIMELNLMMIKMDEFDELNEMLDELLNNNDNQKQEQDYEENASHC